MIVGTTTDPIIFALKLIVIFFALVVYLLSCRLIDRMNQRSKFVGEVTSLCYDQMSDGFKRISYA